MFPRTNKDQGARSGERWMPIHKKPPDAGFLAGGLPLRYHRRCPWTGKCRGSHGWRERPAILGLLACASARSRRPCLHFAPDAAPVRATRRWGTPSVIKTGGTAWGTPMAMDGQVPREPWTAGAASEGSQGGLPERSEEGGIPRRSRHFRLRHGIYEAHHKRRATS